MPAMLEAPTEANPFADLIPKAPTDYGQFFDLVPSGLKAGATVAGQEDFGLFADLVPKSPTAETEKAIAETPALPYETKLSPWDERTFQTWKSQVAPNDSGNDYDFRGAFKAGVLPDRTTGHWPDTFKKPNHPTFSDQSQYAKDRPDLAGRWEGDKFIPPARDSFLELEKGVSNLSGIPFHESMNALRSLSAGAGKYIFEGLQGFEQNRAKILANPPSELTKLQGDEMILPDGSIMSKEQQDALEQQYHDAAIAQIPDAKAKADYFKQVAENADTSQYVDPELAKTIPARIAHAAGSAGVMAVESMIPFAGIPFMVMHGAMATEAEAKNAGKTDAEAEAAGVRSAIGLALFGGASKLAALGVAKLLPDGASSVRTFLTQFVGQEAANETSSRAINAWESAADAPEGKKIEAALNALKDTTLEQSTLNTVYALAHASKAAERAPVRPEAAPEPSVPLKATEIPPATTGELIEQAPTTEVLKSEPQPTGEENGTLSQRSAETEISRPTETGQDQGISSEGMGRSEQGAETAGTPQAQKEPIGVADAIAEIQRRNAPEPSTTGIAQRVHDVRASEGRQGEILPGEGVTAEDMVNRGRNLLNAGADPEKIITGVSAGNAVTGDQMAVLRARHEQFSNATDQAADALRKTPNDPTAKQTYENAFKAETDFAQRIKPAATEWHKVGQSMQGETDIQTGTFTGLRRAFHAITGRDVTPKEAVKLDNTATKVQKANSAVEKAKADFSEVVKTATKNTLPKTAAELRAHFAEKFKAMLPC